LKFNFEATGIGSVPFKDPKEACRLIFDNFKSIPFWPQLPRRSFFENMYVQFAEKIPGVVIDEVNKSIYIDTTGVAETFEEVYGKYAEGDQDFFAVSKNHAQGFYEFLDCLEKKPVSGQFVKGHITGPISFALFLTDENKKSIIYDKDLFEILTKILVMRVKWQIRKLKKYAPGTIIFIDEPYLVSIGSSFVNIDIGAAFDKFDEVAKAIKAEGALAGVHCCGNTDWSALLKRDVDIINFDAYNFMKEFSLYAQNIKEFLQRGGSVAWGIVPSSEAIDNETVKTLIKKLKDGMTLLADKGVPKDAISSIVTSSCGTGSLDEDRTRKIFDAARILSEKLQG